jgi:hypothetical protein
VPVRLPCHTPPSTPRASSCAPSTAGHASAAVAGTTVDADGLNANGKRSTLPPGSVIPTMSDRGVHGSVPAARPPRVLPALCAVWHPSSLPPLVETFTVAAAAAVHPPHRRACPSASLATPLPAQLVLRRARPRPQATRRLRWRARPSTPMASTPTASALRCRRAASSRRCLTEVRATPRHTRPTAATVDLTNPQRRPTASR